MQWSEYTLSQIKADKDLKLRFLSAYSAKFGVPVSSLSFGCSDCLNRYYKKFMENINKKPIRFTISKGYNGLHLSTTIFGVNPKGSQFVLSNINTSEAICQIFYDYHLAVNKGHKVFTKVPDVEVMDSIRLSDEYKSYKVKFNLFSPEEIEAERLLKEKAEKEKAEKEKAEKEKAEKEKTEREKAEREKAEGLDSNNEKAKAETPTSRSKVQTKKQ